MLLCQFPLPVFLSAGDHLLRPLCAVLPLCGLCCGGAAGGDQLGVPPPQAAPAYGQHCHWYTVPGQQHDQPGDVRGVPHQHPGLDDPLAGAQQGQGAPPSLHAGQRGYGHHDGHEHRPLLSAGQERLFEEQHPGDQERERDVKARKGRNTRRMWIINTFIAVR